MHTDKAKPQWTWNCNDYKCERAVFEGGDEQVSLHTCIALCSSSIVWPQPTGEIKLSKTRLPIYAEFTLKITESPSTEVSTYLKKAFALFTSDVNTQKNSRRRRVYHKPKHSLIISVSVKGDKDPRLRIDTDEGYEIFVRPSVKDYIIEVDLLAKSFCGARHGFETLSQLIWFDPYLNALVMIDMAIINDRPKFPYRGLLLDTARNYFPVSDILRTIDAMAATKLNTFHWHAVDSQSFPLKLNSTLKLAKHGAYGPSAVYTREDVQRIVSRARFRGIRVVIEVDAPSHIGHAWSWGPEEKLGDLAHCVETEPWWDFCGEPPCGQLNPHNPNVLSILENIYKEIIELTGVKDVFHIGGDEVIQTCWKENEPECIHSPVCKSDEVWIIFLHNVYKALERANGGSAPNMTMIWSSSLTKREYLKKLKKFTIQYWDLGRSPDILPILMTGFRVVLSNQYPWYFDCGFGSWVNDRESHCGNYINWEDVYNYALHMPKGWSIEGGEACMWSEQVGPTDLDGRLWPRGAAFGEKLWTHPRSEASEDVKLRLDVHRSRLVERGVRAMPIFPRWCSENPYSCS